MKNRTVCGIGISTILNRLLKQLQKHAQRKNADKKNGCSLLNTENIHICLSLFHVSNCMIYTKHGCLLCLRDAEDGIPYGTLFLSIPHIISAGFFYSSHSTHLAQDFLFIPRNAFSAGFFSQYKAAFETVKRGYTERMRANSFKNNAVMRKKDKLILLR